MVSGVPACELMLKLSRKLLRMVTERQLRLPWWPPSLSWLEGHNGGRCTGTLCGGNCRVCRPESGQCNPRYLKFGRSADLYISEI